MELKNKGRKAPVPQLVVKWAQDLDYAVQKAKQAKDQARVLQLVEYNVDLYPLYLDNDSIHYAIRDFSISIKDKLDIIRSYYAALQAIGRAPPPQDSVLFRDQTSNAMKRNVYAIFGGQGIVNSYFSELLDLFAMYQSFITDLLQASQKLLLKLIQGYGVEHLFAEGFDLMKWLRLPSYTPSKAYLLMAPVSLPLIGLVQLSIFEITCKILGLQPGDLRDRFVGVTGYSQGVVVAAAIATVGDWASWRETVKTILTILFVVGLRCQQICPNVSANIGEQTGHDRSSLLTPMLRVRGFNKEQIEARVLEVNAARGPGSCVEISATNGPQDFVITGHPFAVYDLNQHLWKANASPSEDRQDAARQSSKQLSVSVPFHNKYLDAALTWIGYDLKDLEIHANELKIPVYSTKTGADLRGISGNIIPELTRLITRDTLDWPTATSFPNATHILDFGPGGVDGIGALTSRNKKSTGVRVILAGTLCGTSPGVGYQPEIFAQE
jgi:fatty acid synthase subunit beta